MVNKRNAISLPHGRRSGKYRSQSGRPSPRSLGIGKLHGVENLNMDDISHKVLVRRAGPESKDLIYYSISTHSDEL